MAEPLARAGPRAGRSIGSWRLRIETPLLLCLLLAMLAALPLAAPGYFFKAHDARHTIFWAVEFDQAVRDGALWPIWAPDHALGFGYPVWLVYAPLAYVAAEIFHLLGLGFTAAVKATWALGFLLAALGTYRLGRRWWGPAAGLIAGLAYTYAPYHLVQIYVRADLAEFMAWAWFPWAVLALVALWDDPGPRRAGLAGLAVGALLLLHTVSPLIFAPFLLGFFLLKLAQAWRGTRHFPFRPVLWTAGAAILGGMLGAVFLLPALLELRYVQAGQFSAGSYDYTLHFVYPGQFLSPSWGFGYSVLGPNDAMSFQLGLMPFLGGLAGSLAGLGAARSSRPRATLAAPAAAEAAAAGAGQRGGRFNVGPAVRGRPFRGRRRPPKGVIRAAPTPFAPNTERAGWRAGLALPHRAEALFLLAATLAALFMMTGASASLWRVLPFGSLVQFPWRLLGLTMFALALLSGAGVWWLEQRSGGVEGRKSGPTVPSTPPPLHSSASTRFGPFAYIAALAIVLASFAYTRPELQPIREIDEKPQAVVEFETTYKDMRGMTAWSERKPAESDSPLLADYDADRPLQRAAVVAGEGAVLAQGSAAASAWASVEARSPVRLRFYSYYFPGWQATVDGRVVEIAPDPPLGLIGLDLPPGQHEVKLRFGATPLRRGAGALSLGALATAFLLLALGLRRSSQPGM